LTPEAFDSNRMWEINNIPGRYIPSIFGVKFLSELKDFTPGIGFVPRD